MKKKPGSAGDDEEEGHVGTVSPPRPVARFGQAGGVDAGSLRALRRLGFDAPTPIQALALPALLAGRDVLGVAATGTGKTLAFVLPALAHCEAARRASAFHVRRGSVRGPAALALAPTRELAAQTLAFARRFANARSERASTDLDRPPKTSTEASARRDPIACGACFGGADKSDQIRDVLRGACEFAVGTPGRALDLCRVRSLGYGQKTQTQTGGGGVGGGGGGGGVVTLLRGVTFVALDEADAMLFPRESATARATRSLVSATSRHRVVAAFTATAPGGKVRDAVLDAFGDADGGAFGDSDGEKSRNVVVVEARAPGRAGPSEAEEATENARRRS
jgi:superfamily II DNA/RNA helicase